MCKKRVKLPTQAYNANSSSGMTILIQVAPCYEGAQMLITAGMTQHLVNTIEYNTFAVIGKLVAL
jgi:hypothetical protein